MLRKLDPNDVQLAKADAVRVDRERLAEVLRRMFFNIEGDAESQRYRKGWNDAITNVLDVVEGRYAPR